MPARVTPDADEVKIEDIDDARSSSTAIAGGCSDGGNRLGGVESGDASRMSFVARRKQVVAPNTREQSLRYVRPMSKNMLAHGAHALSAVTAAAGRLHGPSTPVRCTVVQSQEVAAQLQRSSMVIADEKGRSHARALHRDQNYAVVCAFIGMAAAMAEADILLSNENVPNKTTFVLKCVVSVSTVMLLDMMWLMQRHRNMLLRRSGFLEKQQTVFRTAELHKIIIELCICAVHSPPGADWAFTLGNASGVKATYTIDGLAALFMLARLVIFAPLAHRYLGLHSAKAKLVAKWNNVQVSMTYTFKAMLAEHPLSTVLFLMVTSILLLSYALRVFEIGVCTPAATPGMACQRSAFKEYRNCCWNTLITMTTVGFGDIYPVTDGGRLISGASAITGVVIISILVTITQQATELGVAEARVLDIILQDDLRYQKVRVAATFLQRAFRAHRRFKEHGRNSYQSFNEDRAFSMAMAQWRSIQKKCNGMLTFGSAHADTHVSQHVSRRRGSSGCSLRPLTLATPLDASTPTARCSLSRFSEVGCTQPGRGFRSTLGSAGRA